ncbi:MAG TPA: glycosyl hydrolase family 79 C-terminal domain-containing protein [Solirubrobacteraceae bacterium]
MPLRPVRILALGALAAVLLVAWLTFGLAHESGAAADAAAATPIVSASVGGSPLGQTMPSGFVGLSVEYKALHQYTGRDPRAVNPVLEQLVKNLAPGQSPVLRIGGDSADWTWWPARGVIPKGGVSYALTKGWLRTTKALAAELHAKLILDLNLAANRPSLSAAEAHALVQGIGKRYISALEIGNEPDLYGVFAWYRDRLGHVVHARGQHYDMKSFTADYSRFRAALPQMSLIGPSFSALTWMSGLTKFLKAEKSVKTVSQHRYPLHNSTTDPTNDTYPTIANLLADSSSAGIAQEVAPYVRTAHSRKLNFRVDEMNSVSGSGHAGVSDTFASALWVLDTLFNLANVGVQGVNVHTLPGAAYQPFSFSQTDGKWQAAVTPEYYGMLLFAQAFPSGARLLPVNAPAGSLKIWATKGADGKTRVILINKSPTTPVSVQLNLPNSTAPATLGRLTAPSVSSTSGVTLNGQTFGDETSTGTPTGSEQLQRVTPAGGEYSIDVPAGSAALLTQ